MLENGIKNYFCQIVQIFINLAPNANRSPLIPVLTKASICIFQHPSLVTILNTDDIKKLNEEFNSDGFTRT